MKSRLQDYTWALFARACQRLERACPARPRARQCLRAGIGASELTAGRERRRSAWKGRPAGVCAGRRGRLALGGRARQQTAAAGRGRGSHGPRVVGRGGGGAPRGRAAIRRGRVGGACGGASAADALPAHAQPTDIVQEPGTAPRRSLRPRARPRAHPPELRRPRSPRPPQCLAARPRVLTACLPPSSFWAGCGRGRETPLRKKAMRKGANAPPVRAPPPLPSTPLPLGPPYPPPAPPPRAAPPARPTCCACPQPPPTDSRFLRAPRFADPTYKVRLRPPAAPLRAAREGDRPQRGIWRPPPPPSRVRTR